MLAEHLTKLDENGLSIETAISDKLDITKAMVVDSLCTIDQNNMADILDKKQGKNIKPCSKALARDTAVMYSVLLSVPLHKIGMQD